MKRIGYVCTYIPLEIIEAFGFIAERILPKGETEKEDALLDPNFCPYVRALFTHLSLRKDLSGLVFTDACDGMRRLFDAVKRKLSIPTFLFNVPRKADETSVFFFKSCLEDFILWLKEISGLDLKEENLRRAIEQNNETKRLLEELIKKGIKKSLLFDLIKEGFSKERAVFNLSLKEALSSFSFEEGKIKILLTGSILEQKELLEFLEDLSAKILFLDFCTGFRFTEPIEIEDEPLMALSRSYLTKPACGRMVDGRRKRLLQSLIGEAQGLIYYVPKFCDPYLYELPLLKRLCNEKGVSFLFLEGEYSERLTGQMKTRIQAFLERWL